MYFIHRCCYLLLCFRLQVTENSNQTGLSRKPEEKNHHNKTQQQQRRACIDFPLEQTLPMVTSGLSRLNPASHPTERNHLSSPKSTVRSPWPGYGHGSARNQSLWPRCVFILSCHLLIIEAFKVTRSWGFLLVGGGVAPEKTKAAVPT